MDVYFHVLTLNKSYLITASQYAASISVETTEWNFKGKF